MGSQRRYLGRALHEWPELHWHHRGELVHGDGEHPAKFFHHRLCFIALLRAGSELRSPNINRHHYIGRNPDPGFQLCPWFYSVYYSGLYDLQFAQPADRGASRESVQTPDQLFVVLFHERESRQQCGNHCSAPGTEGCVKSCLVGQGLTFIVGESASMPRA